MRPGEAGFLIATFSDESDIETEVPNSLISLAKSAKPKSAPVKAKAKAKGKAKAKAKVKAASTALPKPEPKGKAKAKAKAAAVNNPDCVFDRYYYPKSAACGTRQKLPQRFQMFQFGNASVTKSDLYEIADQCIKRLLANDLSKTNSKAWCVQRFEAVKES